MTWSEEIRVGLERAFISDMQGDEPVNIVDGLFAIAHSNHEIAGALQRLGNADAATPMGAIEALGKIHAEGMEEIASAISGIGDAIDRAAIDVSGAPK